MLLLALDTSTEVTSVALARVEGDSLELLGGQSVDAPRAALSRVLPMAASLLAQAGLSACDLDGVVVGRGPGSFTGVRIGVASAKGLAHGLGVPLWGVGTLDAIAQGFADDDVTLAVVGDAMRGEVYPALFTCGGGRVQRLTPDLVAKPDVAMRRFAQHGGRLLLVGNGLKKYAPVFLDGLGDAATLADESRQAPSPGGLILAWVAARDADELGDGDPGAILPVYTRLSDAEEAERDRAGLPRLESPDSGVAGSDVAQDGTSEVEAG